LIDVARLGDSTSKEVRDAIELGAPFCFRSGNEGDLLTTSSIDALLGREELPVSAPMVAEQARDERPPQQTSMSIADYHRYVSGTGSQSSGPLYAQQIPIDPFAPGGLAGSEAPAGLPDRSLFKQANLWYGPGGTLSPLHFDESHNFLHQHHGRKSVRLVSPEFYRELDPGAPGSRFRHMSQLDDSEVLAILRSGTVATAEVELEAGDVLFIPAYWWHRVEALDVSISVNYWWRPPLGACLYAAFADSLADAALFMAPHKLARLLDLSGNAVDLNLCERLARDGQAAAASVLTSAIVTSYLAFLARGILSVDPGELDGSVQRRLDLAKTTVEAMERASIVTDGQASLMVEWAVDPRSALESAGEPEWVAERIEQLIDALGVISAMR
jgi:hypothetical protein